MALVQGSTSLESLSPQERRICERIADGALHKTVARELAISVRTVHTHVHRAAAKLPGQGRPTPKIVRFFTMVQASDSAA